MKDPVHDVNHLDMMLDTDDNDKSSGGAVEG